MPRFSRLVPFRLSIRFRISVILLLATLNTVALAGVSIVLFSALRQGATISEVNEVRSLVNVVTAVNERVLAEAPGADLERDVARALDGVATRLAGWKDRSRDADAELLSYRAAVDRFYQHRHALGAGSLADTDDPHGKSHLGELRLASRHLVGTLQMLITTQRPPWLDAAEAALTPAMAWVVGCAAVTLWLAWGLQNLLSIPLGRLAAGAEAVAAGDLDTVIPVPPGEHEVSRLAVAMAAARDRLVGLIREIDQRNLETATILANMGDGVLLADAEGHVLEANAPADVLLRALAGDTTRAEGSNVRARVPELEPAWIDPQAESGAVISRGGGAMRRRWVEARLRRVPGRERQRVVLLQDITDARELEQLKNDFMSVVTHELKTPLTAIEGYAKLLLRGKGGELPERARGFVDTIHLQSGVLKEMVQNLLDTSRLEAGNLPIDAQPHDAGEILRYAASTWRGPVEAKGLVFSADLEPAGGHTIRVDPFRVQQVLGNLIGNAIKFTASGGIGLSGSRVGSDMVFVVNDSGRGIPEEAVGRIFDKFYQVERGDTRVAGGAGLGLYISRALVEAQGGSISITSVVGEGSRFEIRFPIVEAA